MNSETIQVSPTLTEKQKDALRILTDHTNGITTCLYGGSAGGGKSLLGCIWILHNALKYPGTRHCLSGFELKRIKQTTLKTFWEACKMLKLVDGVHYRYSELRGEIRFKNGSEVIVLDLSNRPSDPEFEFLGSFEFMSAFVDEASRISEKAINILSTRIRHKLSQYCDCGRPTITMVVAEINKETFQPTKWKCNNPHCLKVTSGITQKMLLTSNPSRGWLYTEFYKKWRDKNLESFKAFIPSLARDNKFISPEYIKGLERQPKVIRDRLLYGDWEYQDDANMFDLDAINEMFSYYDLSTGEKSAHTKALPTTETDYTGVKYERVPDYRMSIDVARLGDDKTCILVWDGNTIIHFRELTKMKLTDQLPIIKSYQEKWNIPNSKVAADSDGVGSGLVDLIGDGCVAIVNNSRPLNGEMYQHLKAQLYFKAAKMVNENLIKVQFENGDIDVQSFRDRLTQELQVLKREKLDYDGKVMMTPKDKVKQQISRSPDISDAFAYFFYWAVDDNSGFDYSFAIA